MRLGLLVCASSLVLFAGSARAVNEASEDSILAIQEKVERDDQVEARRLLLRRILQRFQSPNFDLVAGGLGRAVHQLARLERIGNTFLSLPGGDELLLDLHQTQGSEHAGPFLAHALGGLGRIRFQDSSDLLLRQVGCSRDVSQDFTLGRRFLGSSSVGHDWVSFRVLGDL